MKHTKKRKPLERRAQVAAALLTSPSIAAAARRAKVHERTVRRWLQDPDFTAELARRRSAALAHASGRIAEVAGQAVDRLARLVLGRYVRDDVAAAAAKTLLSAATRDRETAVLLDRMDRLEQTLLGPDVPGFALENEGEEDD